MNRKILTKAYTVRMSNDSYIRLDEDEIEKVLEGANKGSLVIVRNGVINPSFIVGIMQDRDRMREWMDECAHGFGQGDEAKARGIRPLANIFEGTAIGIKMAESKLLDKATEQIG